MNVEQLTIVAGYLKLDLQRVKAAYEVYEGRMTRYRAEKEFGLPDNTVKRDLAKFTKFVDMLKAMGEAEKRKHSA
jgi:hypothetical protein